ncbi:MAG: MiaB/RimO family radical SAM methylthiotransferase [Thermoleophilia bacterium]
MNPADREKFYTTTLGCKVNFADSQAIIAALGAAGDTPVALVGTCCVTAEGEKQSRKEVRRAARRIGAGGRVFVTGCAARLHPVEFAALAENVVVVTGEPLQAAARINQLLGTELPAAVPAAGAAGSHRTRFFLKVQDGCANGCAYCVIPQVRGLPVSIPAARIMALAEEMVTAGYPELVVSGINAGSWQDEGRDLSVLMDSLAGIHDLKRLRISSIEVTSLTPQLLEVMARRPVIGRHLHLPLQSGDDRVLGAMRRRYNSKVFTEAVARVREAMPDINLTTDVIVGFPGENEIAFNKTMWLIEELGFSKVHVFSYSPRPGTAATVLEDSVPAAVKQRRNRFMRFLSDRLEKAHQQRKLGQLSEVLLESPQGQGVHGAYSSDYTRFIVTGGAPGELVTVRGQAVTAEGVLGRMENHE